MTRGSWTTGFGLLSLLLFTSSAMAQSAPETPPTRPDRTQLPQPVYKVAQKLADASTTTEAQATVPLEHPLVPALKIAYASMENIRGNIKDYSCTVVKRERIGGKLGEHEYMFAKIRHEPFSVYMYFLAPERIKGQEAIYVAGKNDNNLLGHGVGIKKMVGMVSLNPTSALAMAGQRYPITELGVANLTKRLIEVAENDKKFGECEVKFFNGAKINGRNCTCIQVTHPVPRKNFLFHVARVYVDDEMKIPVRYEAYEWPSTPGSQPPLLEEYTYLNVKVNNNFTDADFDDRNPSYGFH